MKTVVSAWWISTSLGLITLTLTSLNTLAEMQAGKSLSAKALHL